MSGIVGFLGLDGRLARAEELERMVEILAHRGPDGRAIWCEGSAGLGHCMLHTTPESLHERLPFARDGLVITADARIDNREELISALGFNRYPTAEITDSQLILAAYEKWGEQCPEKLLGDFSFGILDQRNRVLFCARDYFGVRPFYYYHAPGQFLTFASEIKAIFRLSNVPCLLNEVRIGDYLAVIPGDKEITFYQNIFRLPPAHTLTVNFKGIRLQEYWSMDPVYELRLGSNQEYAEAYLDVFTKAVRCRMRSVFPLGSALSGGLDSSSIVCVVREYLKQQGKLPLKTFSGVFDEVPDSDERPYINAVVEQGDIEPHFVRADRISPLVEWERVLWHQEEPIWTPNLFMHWGLYNSARQQGVRVFLDGFLGDNVVCHGWEYLMDLAYAWRWISLFKEIKGVTQKQAGYSQYQMMWRYLLECSFKPRLYKLLPFNKMIMRSYPLPTRLDPRINPDFAERTNLLQRYQALRPPLPTPPGAARQRQLQDLTAGEIPLALEVSNKTASTFSLEGSYPFTDRRLAEFCLATPSTQRVHNGLSRMIVRRALVDYLPEKVCWRSDKGDLSHNLKKGLLGFEKKLLSEIIFDNSRSIEPYINIVTLRKNYQRYKRQPMNGNFQFIWSAVNLSLWLSQTRTDCFKSKNPGSVLNLEEEVITDTRLTSQ